MSTDNQNHQPIHTPNEVDIALASAKLRTALQAANDFTDIAGETSMVQISPLTAATVLARIEQLETRNTQLARRHASAQDALGRVAFYAGTLVGTEHQEVGGAIMARIHVNTPEGGTGQ